MERGPDSWNCNRWWLQGNHPFCSPVGANDIYGGTATEIEEFEHETRYKIRNSLLETSLVPLLPMLYHLEQRYQS